MIRLLCNIFHGLIPSAYQRCHGHAVRGRASRAIHTTTQSRGRGTRLLHHAAILLLFSFITYHPSASAQNAATLTDAPQAIQPPHLLVALIKLTGPVDGVMYASIQRRVDEARKVSPNGCDLIVYEIDTRGGLLTSAIDISQFNKKLDIPTVAYIHSAAYSAGAVIALSCDQIVMDPEGKLGDCGSIAIDGDAQVAADSPLLKELEDSANVRSWNPVLVRAMVVRGTEAYELHNTITSEVKYAGTEARDKLLHEMATTPDGKSVFAWRLVDPPVNKEGSILTINADQAAKMGFSKATVASEQELLAVLNIRDRLIPMDYSFSEILIRWLVEPAVRSVLFLVMLILAYMEFSHPGTALPGIGALVCLTLLVGAPYWTGLAHAWEIILILVGVIIIVVDLFVYGGIGLLAVPGFILAAIGIVASFVPSEPGQPWVPQMSGTYTALQTGLSVVIFGSLVAVIIFFMLARYLHMTPGLRRLQLAPARAGASGAIVSDVTARAADEAVFVGAIGKVVADLHPAGKAEFGKQLVDVMAQAQFIPAGTVVEVIEIAGQNVLVKPRI